MKTSCFALLSIIVPIAIADPAPARRVDLMAAYRQSAETSPLLAQAEARLQAEQSGKDIARSALGPRLRAEGSASLSDIELTGFGAQPIDESYSPYTYGLVLSQPLINASAWSALQAARANVDALEAELESVRQALMLHVANAYFGVLRSQAIERTAASQLALLQEIADRAASRHRAGTGDIIAVEESRARLDAAQAAQLEAENQTRLAFRALERLTHQSATALSDLTAQDSQPPLSGSMDEWEVIAEKHQPALRRARMGVEANRAWARSQRQRRWPVVSLNAQYNRADGSFAPNIEREESVVGVGAVWPLFQSGEINATSARAASLAEASQYGLENLEDEVQLNTRQAFLDLENSVSQLNAAKRAAESAATALNATRKGYEAGSRTMADVLDSAQRQAKADSSKYAALYNHVLARLRLKAAAGVLSESDLEAVNALLAHSTPSP